MRNNKNLQKNLGRPGVQPTRNLGPLFKISSCTISDVETVTMVQQSLLQTTDIAFDDSHVPRAQPCRRVGRMNYLFCIPLLLLAVCCSCHA